MNIAVLRVHVSSRSLVLDVVADPMNKGPNCEIYISDDVDGNAIEHGENAEEGEIGNKLEKV